METNLNPAINEELKRKGGRLITAARSFWEVHQKIGGPRAVVWLKDGSGHLVVFTRFEYAQRILAGIAPISEEIPLNDPFVVDDEKIQDGCHLIATERKRQLDEGFTAEHDDEYNDWQLITAARCYSIATNKNSPLHPNWPWLARWWKPTDGHIGNLVKSGALIAAEIDRLLREQAKATS